MFSPLFGGWSLGARGISPLDFSPPYGILPSPNARQEQEMEEELYRKVVSAVPLLRPLDRDELSEIIGISRLIKVRQGVTVIKEGEQGASVYIIVAGQARVVKKLPKGKTKVLAELGPGEVFGEMALIDSSPRSASVVTLAESVLYELDLDEFNKLRRDYRSSAFKVLRQMAPVMCRRLRQINEISKEMLKASAPANIQEAAERLLNY
jgi:CRP-like cAMP-binding protein